MGKFAPVAPIQIYDWLDRRGILGGYHLLIGPNVIRNLDAYILFYQSLRDRGAEPLIILDNGVWENELVDTSLLVDAGNAIGADVMVLPDVIGDAQATILASEHAMDKMGDFAGVYMAVAQGNTEPEVLNCAAVLLESTPAEFIGLPRHIGDKGGSRRRLSRIIRENLGTRCHLLGISTNMVDDFLAVREGAAGIDSALPMYLTRNSLLFEARKPPNNKRQVRPENYWDWKEPGLRCRDNLKEIRQLLGA